MALSYPVDLNKKYVAYSIAAADVVTKPRPWPNATGDPIDGLDPDLIPLLVTEGTKPPISDPLTEKITGAFVVDLGADEYRREYSLVTQTAAEQQESQEQAELETKLAQAKTLYPQLLAGTASNNASQRAIAFLLKEFFRGQFPNE